MHKKMTCVGQKSEKGYQALNRWERRVCFQLLSYSFKGLIMKLNFKGFFKAAGLFPLARMPSGCSSYAVFCQNTKNQRLNLLTHSLINLCHPQSYD
ncbi:hypothetical protein EXW06_16115, partial [Enterococcus faecium]|nr:hypothetical protein [Enterococcus faecium]